MDQHIRRSAIKNTTLIDVDDVSEVADWCRLLNAPEATVIDAVRAVGPMAAAVVAHLHAVSQRSPCC